MRPKTKLFAVKFRRILDVLCLQGFTKKVLGAIPRFVCPKMKLFAAKFRRILEVLCLEDLKKSSGCNSTICASKNEAVCREIQTHSGSSLPASFKEKVLGAIPGFVRPKIELFAVKFKRISEVSAFYVYREISGQIFTICVSKN